MIESKKYSTVMSTLLKEGTSGEFKIRKTTVPTGTILQTYDSKHGRLYKDVLLGDFPTVVLSQKDDTWMSDTPLEQESSKPAVVNARGDVLICGLGIGLVPTLIKDKPEIKSIDIVEISLNVVKLVWQRIKSPKMRLIHGVAWKYLAKCEEKYDFIHIDIWGSITAPIMEVKKARDLAKRCLKPNGQIRCWMEELYFRVVNALPKQPMHSTQPAGFHDPCLICGKTWRNDYAGLCMDCSDCLGLSELFIGKE